MLSIANVKSTFQSMKSFVERKKSLLAENLYIKKTLTKKIKKTASLVADNVCSIETLIKKIEKKKSLLAGDLCILSDYIDEQEFKDINMEQHLQGLEKSFNEACEIFQAFESIGFTNRDLKSLKGSKGALDYSISQIKKYTLFFVVKKIDNFSQYLAEVESYASKIQEENSEYNKEHSAQLKKKAYEEIIRSGFEKIVEFRAKLNITKNLEEVIKIDIEIDEFKSKTMPIVTKKKIPQKHDANQELKKLQKAPIQSMQQVVESQEDINKLKTQSIKNHDAPTLPPRYDLENTNTNTLKAKSIKNHDAPKTPTRYDLENTNTNKLKAQSIKKHDAPKPLTR